MQHLHRSSAVVVRLSSKVMRFGLRHFRGFAASAAIAFAAGTQSNSMGQPVVTGKTDVAATRWLKLQTISYIDENGQPRKWDMASRTTKSSASADAVAILALLRHSSSPSKPIETLLVTQFRPPLNAVTVELPAGLIDTGETAEAAALRELKEETGYVGSVVQCSEALAMSPGLCDETIKLCVVEVDLDAPENRIPEQALEETEMIQVTRVPINMLLPKLHEMRSEGLLPFTGLYMLAVGFSSELKKLTSVIAEK
ncbi:hypothetical protein AB1Y20_016971 [Prymnesium parvum]|uniref:Nudix hydrolase domain-containing protein n=1 Tax=Prymnesium parvum TaxID=97485 RepID=A0AB34IA50_PRYPA|mmetsp:Transcript_37399/g.85709  ORF Transcript_37399/g.85709 Transcript_37399/m.85709 type:complete len:255 (-) Transcript_37399:77-841(-)